jgi:L-lactate dehydrogenase complex protein LldG
VKDIHQACQSIRALIEEKEVTRAVLWDHPLTRAVMETLDEDQKVQWLVWNTSRFEDQRSDDQGKNRLSAMDLGLTAADFALADSGSLVLVAGEGRDPLVSMLPPLHVALLQENQILEGIDLLMEQIGGRKWPESGSFSLISGPSRTGDIELTMSLGVHGPREVHVVLGKDFS